MTFLQIYFFFFLKLKNTKHIKSAYFILFLKNKAIETGIKLFNNFFHRKLFKSLKTHSTYECNENFLKDK